ncbi:MAG: hypothetical protein JXB10_03640 [Pirellulales bacterium]|nr:hypothetical protein [Pirellulales bacterium]
MQFATIPLLTLLALSISSGPCFAGTAESKVRKGIESFQSGDFKAASTAFSEAAGAAPDDRRIAFDSGCAHLARQEYAKAVTQFQRSALAKDPKLAAESSYNLGCTMIAQAKAAFGEKPEEIEGEARVKGLELLRTAAKYYRDCLALVPDHANARYNLETVRLWSKHIQDVWRRRDREKRLRQMNLMQLLEMLETEQRALRGQARELDPVRNSPKKREEVRNLEDSQRQLAEDVEPLKQKVDAILHPQQPAGAPQTAAPKPPSGDLKKAVELLTGLADDARDRMNQAADDLAEQKLLPARAPQAKAVEKVDQMFMVAAPYVDLVKKGINRQEPLVKLSEEATAKKTPRDGNPGGEKDAASPNAPPASEPFDAANASWNQKFIEYYGRVIPAKARRELEQLEKQSSPLPDHSVVPGEGKGEGGEKEKNPNSSNPQAAGPHPNPLPKVEGTDQALKAEEQRREMKKALQAGIELAPKVEKLAAEAADLLQQENPAEALPKQREALKLLKEMLPKQPPQQNQDKKDQQKQKNQDQKDQKKQQQNQKDKKDQKKDEKKDQKQKQQPKKQNQEKKEQKPQEQQSAAEKKMTPQQAEAVLRKARAREDEHREKKKALEEYLYRPERVDKDW